MAKSVGLEVVTETLVKVAEAGVASVSVILIGAAATEFSLRTHKHSKVSHGNCVGTYPS